MGQRMTGYARRQIANMGGWASKEHVYLDGKVLDPSEVVLASYPVQAIAKDMEGKHAVIDVTIAVRADGSYRRLRASDGVYWSIEEYATPTRVIVRMVRKLGGRFLG